MVTHFLNMVTNHPQDCQPPSLVVQGTELNLGGGTPHRKSVYIFSEQGTRGGGTPHIKTVSQYKLQVRLTAGWVGGPVI